MSRIDWSMVMARWNALATKHSLPKIQRLNAHRKMHYKRRIAEDPNWWGILAKEIPVVTGFMEDHIHFDFCLQPSSFQKLSEGIYRSPDKIRQLAVNRNNKTSRARVRQKEAVRKEEALTPERQREYVSKFLNRFNRKTRAE